MLTYRHDGEKGKKMIKYEKFKQTIRGYDQDEKWLDKWEVWGYIGKRIFYNITILLTEEESEKDGDEFEEILNKKAYEEFKYYVE